MRINVRFGWGPGGLGTFCHRPPPAFIVGHPGNASALVLPDVEDIIGKPRGWHLPSAIAEARLVVESDYAHQPHVYAYIRYVRPLVAWCLLLVGWFGYSAVTPVYSLYPPPWGWLADPPPTSHPP